MLTIQKLPLCSKGAPVAITLENSNHMRVTLLSYGATIQSIVVPDQNGVLTDVLLGYETVKEYEENDGYLGACIGRNGNRIAGAAFTLNGQRFHLTANEGKNQLHGGLCGFDKKLWNYNCRENSVEFTTVLSDGEEGYPGRLDVSITFTLTDDNALHIDYRAVSSADTVANFTNHAYFNLNGQGSGDVLGHLLQPIGQDIHDAALAPFRGYDTNLCLDGQGLRKIGQAEGDQTGIVMEVETTLEGVQLYTGNFISDRAGKNGARYASYSGFCLETQHYPDAINQPAFPSPVLRQGEALHETTVYRFCVRK